MDTSNWVGIIILLVLVGGPMVYRRGRNSVLDAQHREGEILKRLNDEMREEQRREPAASKRLE